MPRGPASGASATPTRAPPLRPAPRGTGGELGAVPPSRLTADEPRWAVALASGQFSESGAAPTTACRQGQRVQEPQLAAADEDPGAGLRRCWRPPVAGRLLALALDLHAADASTGDADAHLALTDAVASLRTAIDEVRRLGSGTAPEVLSQGGLSPALADLTRRMPVPVSLDVLADRLDPATEVIAYPVVSEAVTNAVKHAGPCGVDVTVALAEGTVTIRVANDGSGGADLLGGTGLRGLAERVNAAGGTFVVAEGRARGTLLEAVLPCGR